MRAFLIASGLFLALAGAIGIARALIELATMSGNSPAAVLWWEAMVGSVAFLIGGIGVFVLSGRVGPSRHWAISVIGVISAFVVVGVLRGGVQVAILGI
jgi:hypothetical protein